MEPSGVGNRQRSADDAATVADDERHLLRRAHRGGDDHVALVLPVVVVGHDDDLAAGERLDGFSDGMAHVVPLSRCRRGEEKIVGRDCAAGFGDDPLGGLARQPPAVVAADQRHGARGNADAPRKVRARNAVSPEPVGELHTRKKTAAMDAPRAASKTRARRRAEWRGASHPKPAVPAREATGKAKRSGFQ